MKTFEFSLCVALFLLTFFLTVICVGVLIPLFRHHRAGQPILEIGPSWHSAKAGTPTMGGLGFMAAILSVMLLYSLLQYKIGVAEHFLRVVLVLFFAVLCGVVGMIDDYIKLHRKENKGLSAPAKFFLLLMVSSLFLFVARALGYIDTAIVLPFGNGVWDMGIIYYPLALLFLTGVVNALNLTDGVDGLLSSTVAVISAFFLLYGITANDGVFWFFGTLLLGATLGFLVFNAHPAKIFMGDTGSLFLGGLLAGVGIISQKPLTVLCAGGVFVTEAASVILQVLYFKISKGKRLFLMAPLHHHFEKRGLSENGIVGVFSLATLLFSALAFFRG